MCIIFETLCCTPENNIFYVNYTSIKNERKHNNICLSPKKEKLRNKSKKICIGGYMRGNYKALLKKIKGHLNEWADSSYS